MAVDFSLPKLTQLYNTELLPSIRENQAGLARMFNGDTLLNTPDKTIRYNASQTRFEIYNSGTSAWTALLPSYIASTGGMYTGNLAGETLTLTSDLNVSGATNGTSAMFTGTLVAGIFSVTSNAIFNGNVTLNGVNFYFNGLGQRILGNFSASALTDRTTFQSALANQTTLLQAMPSGTGNQSGFTFLNSSTPANAGGIQLNTTGAFANFNVVNYGTPTSTVATINFSFNTASVFRMEPTVVTSIVPVVLPADPTTALQAATKQYVDSLSAGGHGQCRLTLDGSNLRLIPYNGNKIIVGGVTRIIPSGGIALAPVGTANNTVYRIYLYWNGTSLALENSLTSHSTDATNGVEIKTGDASRTLVGLVCTGASGAWVDLPTARRVISYFNRRDIPLLSKLTVTGAFSTATTYASFHTSLIVDFVCWPDEANTFIAQVLTYTTGVVTFFNSTAIGFDANPGDEGVTTYMGVDPNTHALAPTAGAQLSEGIHSANVMVKTDNGGRMYVDNLAGASSLIRGVIRG